MAEDDIKSTLLAGWSQQMTGRLVCLYEVCLEYGITLVHLIHGSPGFSSYSSPYPVLI